MGVVTVEIVVRSECLQLVCVRSRGGRVDNHDVAWESRRLNCRLMRVLHRRGRLLTCGATAGYDPQEDLRFMWTFELQILGSKANRAARHRR